MVFAGERAAEVASFYADWTAGGLPDELTTILNLTTAPPAPFLPESIHGKPVAIVAACYAGPADEGERALAPVRGLGDPVADLLPPAALHRDAAAARPAVGSRRAQPHEGRLPGRPRAPGAIDALLRGWEAKPSPMSELHIHHMGGAAARVPARQLAPSRTATRRTSPTSSRAGPTPRPTTSRSSGAVTSTPRSPSTRPAARTSTSSQTRGRIASARPTATTPTAGCRRSSATTTPTMPSTATRTSSPRST